MVFLLDSVITAVGMVDQVSVMIAAVTVAIVVCWSRRAVAGVVNRHPTLKMLALSYAADRQPFSWKASTSTSPRATSTSLGFSVFVELLNIRVGAAERALTPRGVASALRGVGRGVRSLAVMSLRRS